MYNKLLFLPNLIAYAAKLQRIQLLPTPVGVNIIPNLVCRSPPRNTLLITLHGVSIQERDSCVYLSSNEETY